MTRVLLPVLFALAFPLALLLYVKRLPSLALVLRARASPPGAAAPRTRPALPPIGRSPPPVP